MAIRHGMLIGTVLLSMTSASEAQTRWLSPAPGFGFPRHRIYVTASYGNFYGPALYPGFGYGLPYGTVEPRVSVQIVTPPPAPRFIALPPPVDLSGVDLDLGAPPWAKDFDRPRIGVPPAPKPQLPEVAKRIEPVREPPQRPDVPDPLEAKANPIQEAQRLTGLGIAAFRTQDYGLAARRFNQAIEIDPAGGRAYYLLSQAYFALGKYREAVQMIGLGLGVDPAWPRDAFRPRSVLYADQPDDWRHHLQMLEEAHARQPNHAGYLFLLAHQRWFDDHRADALRLFQQVRPLVADPSLVDLFLKAL